MENGNSAVKIGSGQPQADEQLNSWKEIASYLNREVRTVRRWETYEGLPVHRHLHNVRGSVYAFRTEIDAWWTNRRTQPRSSSVVLAVLPFEYLNARREQEGMGKGLSAEIATQLIRLNLTKLRVTNCSTVGGKTPRERISKATDELGATHLIGGTIRSDRDCILINVYLQKASDGTYVWAESYGRPQAAGIAEQVEVARLIAHSIISKLVPGERVSPPRVVADASAVQKACTEGRSSWNKRSAEGLVKAIACFDQAIQQDPTYAPAYAGLADSYLQLGFYGILPAVPAMKKAKSAALKAVELDDSSGEAHASLADVMKYFDWNLVGAEKEYQRAIQLDPVYATAHHWYGDYLAMMGRFAEAHAKGQRALELDPVSPIINTWVGMQFYLSGLYEAAVEQLRKTRGMHPNYALCRWALGLVYDQQLKFDEAIAEKQKAVSLSGDSPWIIAGLGCSYAASGKRDEARKILERLVGPAHQTHSISYEIATIYAAVNDRDSALQWLQRAHDDHSAWVPFMNVEPRLRTLRSDKRFQQLANCFSAAQA
jgi:tetratricopeptide (TPR) repeat protein/TolB-like protein